MVVADDGGSLLFVDLEDYTVRVDDALNTKYRGTYGWFDLEGITMTECETSIFLYLGMENVPSVLEYDWRETQRITRRFDLPGFGRVGVQSLVWVPTEASAHQGYFYTSSRDSSNVFVYELPLLDSTGPQAEAVLRNTWRPREGNGNKRLAAMAYSGGYIFLCYDSGGSSHVLIYPILSNGLYGRLAEQYQVDVVSGEGLAVRQRANHTWDVYFVSDTERAVFVYTFRFVTGFQLHSRCSATEEARDAIDGPQGAGAARTSAASALALAALSAALLAEGAAGCLDGHWRSLA